LPSVLDVDTCRSSRSTQARFLLTRPRRHSTRWRVTLRGELLGYVYATTWPAAVERAVRRWKLSREDQEELRVEKAE
jgi:hypothetical protein